MSISILCIWLTINNPSTHGVLFLRKILDNTDLMIQTQTTARAMCAKLSIFFHKYIINLEVQWIYLLIYPAPKETRKS